MTTAAQRAAYTYTEPHPSVPTTQRLSTGRGGAGNATRLCPKSTTNGATASGPASRSPLVSPALAPRRVTVGRGGAGNVKSSAIKGIENEPTVYELERDARHNHADAIDAEARIWHYGRGGHGNVLDQTKSRQNSDASSGNSRRGSVLSSVSSGSGGERRTSRTGSFVNKVTNKLRRGSDEIVN